MNKDQKNANFARTILRINRALLPPFFRSPKSLVFFLIAYVGILMALSPLLGISFVSLFSKYGISIIGTLLTLVGLALTIDDIKKSSISRENKFIDVDARAKFAQHKNDLYYAKLADSITDKSTIAKTTARPKKASTDENETKLANTKSHFEQYFESIRQLLEQKAQVSDEKASILLDKGVAYSRLGIILFITSIIGWQIISWMHGFQTQYIYGIASCSVLFAFIEFLSAWFLKQYRQFVDTSTYLIKVKSIFDKYMLTYLAVNEFRTGKDNELEKQVIDLLKAEMSWPETYLTKNQDIGFAKEAIDSLTSLISAIKTQESKK